jgi:hypothetical protein
VRLNSKNGGIFIAAAVLFHLVTAPCASAQNFTLTGGMNIARLSHSATLLNNGKVLIVGGYNEATFGLAPAELYDPATRTFTITGSLNIGRAYHTATLLNNGMVLITGGENQNPSPSNFPTSAELYNPATGTFTLTGSMSTPRVYHTATLLDDGTVLIAGGFGFDTFPALASAEIYNPVTGTFTLTGSLNTPRGEHTATLLNNGIVLIAGGNNDIAFLTTAELFNPATGNFTLTGSMNVARSAAMATLIGYLNITTEVILVGGDFTLSPNTPATAELYDSNTGTWKFTGSPDSLDLHTVTLLNNGMLLVAGGQSAATGCCLASAQLYNPVTGTFTFTGSLNTGRVFHSATLLNNGNVLIAGGADVATGNLTALSSAELYTPSTTTGSTRVESITQPLSPNALNEFQFDNNVHNFSVQYPPGTNFSGVNMTVRATQVSQVSFQGRLSGTPFANALCIAYEGENDFCEDYQVSCTDTAGHAIACPSATSPINVITSYSSQQTIVNPGFLTAPLGTNEWTNIFYTISVPRIDASTKGHTTGFSEFVAVDLGTSGVQAATRFPALGSHEATAVPVSGMQAPPQFRLFGALQNDVRIFPAGTLIPIEFQLISAAHPGQPITDATAGITVSKLSGTNGSVRSSFVLENPSAFHFESGKYVFDLNTAGFAPGVYNVTIFGDAFVPQSVGFTVPVPTSSVHLVATLQSLTLSSNKNHYVAVFSIANSGTDIANGVTVTASQLNSTSTSQLLPVSLGNIASGKSATVALVYPTSAGAGGSRGSITISESYAGGSAGGGSRVTLP